MVGGAIPGRGPDSIAKQAEQAMRNKPVSSTPPWPLHQLCPRFQPSLSPVLIVFSDGLQCGSVSLMNPLVPSSPFGHGVSSQQ